MENEQFDKLVQKLRKLAVILIMDGIGSKNSDKLVLGNSISIALGAIEAGGEIKSDLLAALNPISEKLRDELQKKNPGVKPRFTSISEDEFPELRDIGRKVAENEIGNVKIEDLLTGTGVSPSKEIKE